MSRPTISCIIPVYNGEHYLAEAIDSLLAQTLPATQIIIIDDGSTDGTAGIIDGYGDRVISVHQENSGVSLARNRAIEMAGGDLICFLDADDLLHPDKLKLQVERLDQQDDLGLCECYSKYFWSEELTPEQLASDPRHSDPFWKLRLCGHISTWLIRRQVFDRVGLFKPGMSYAEDVDWRTRMIDAGTITDTLAQTLTYRRLHPANVTGHNRAAQVDGLASAMKAHLDRVRKTS